VLIFNTPERTRHLEEIIVPKIYTVFTKGQPSQRHLLQYFGKNIANYMLMPKTSNLTQPELMRNSGAGRRLQLQTGKQLREMKRLEKVYGIPTTIKGIFPTGFFCFSKMIFVCFPGTNLGLSFEITRVQPVFLENGVKVGTIPAGHGGGTADVAPRKPHKTDKIPFFKGVLCFFERL